MKVSSKTFAAVAIVAVSLSFQSAARADFMDFLKGVGNVLTGGMISLAEGAKKIADGKAKPGDIVNVVTGGLAGAVTSAVKTGAEIHKAVSSVATGIGNMVSDIFKHIGVTLPKLPSLPGLPGLPN